MKTIYINSEYKCFPEYEEGARAVETDSFDGKCDAYIKGMRFIPQGESYDRGDGEIIVGEAVFPWIDYAILEAAQQKYEETSEELAAATAELEDADAALYELGVEWEESNE